MRILVEINELARLKPVTKPRKEPQRAPDFEVRIRGADKQPFDQKRAEELKEKINAALRGGHRFSVETAGQNTRRFQTMDDLKGLAAFQIHLDPLHDKLGSTHVSEEQNNKFFTRRSASSDTAGRLPEYAVVLQFTRDPGAARKMAQWLKTRLEQDGHAVETRGVCRPGEE